MHAYKGGPAVRTALLLAPLLYQRPGNLRVMEWAELDLDAALWTIPSAKIDLNRAKANGDGKAPSQWFNTTYLRDYLKDKEKGCAVLQAHIREKTQALEGMTCDCAKFLSACGACKN